MKPLLTIGGVVLLVGGLFFAAQGAGLIRWPAESFMVGTTRWVYYGAGIAIAGLLLILAARR